MSLSNDLSAAEQERMDGLARHFGRIVFEEHDKQGGLDFFRALDDRTRRYIQVHEYYKLVLKCAQMQL
jgi:hypothetical protein